MRWLRPGFRGFSGVSSMLKLETFLLLQFFLLISWKTNEKTGKDQSLSICQNIHQQKCQLPNTSYVQYGKWWLNIWMMGSRSQNLTVLLIYELPYTTLPSISTLWYYTTLNALFHQIACSLINTSPPWWSKLKAKIMMTAQFNCKVRWTLAQIRLDTKIKQVKKKKKKKKSRNIYLKKALLNSYLLQTRHH